MTALPDSITSGAFVASNGEFGWQRQDVEPAIYAIRDAAYAVLGGEAWLVTGPHSWHGMFPQRDGSPPAVYHWETQPRSLHESWQAYCARTAQESIDTVRSMATEIEQEIPAELIECLRFNLSYVAEQEV